jgi:hypothetical protein
MKKEIFVQLMDEGIRVYRPVPAIQIESNVYLICGEDIFDPEIEEWEFKPKTMVLVEEQERKDKKILIAVKEVKDN